MINAPAIVVFGSLHYDIIVKGPARPRKGETLIGEAWNPACGGKGGNQAVSAARKGVRSAMIGAVADDAFGGALLAHLDQHGVERQHVRVLEGAGTGMSVALFDAEGDYGAVVVSGSNLRLGREDVEAAAALFAPGNILLLQNEVPEAGNILAASAMKRAGGRVILNAAPAKPLSPELAALVDILVVNALEAEALAGCAAIEGLQDALVAARMLSRDFGTAVVTAGGEGVAYAVRDGREGCIPAIKVKLVSTHGAGDEFIGALASELLLGRDIGQALEVANRAAAALVSRER
ncbi:ribokinase [Rhizobium sp. C4]|uniref:ribokinase n=1 Tax=Rhizobium sp. C4 TaxID=1349800 RepID=UPI001E3F85A6|nr:ribokinase [Rhizobium sp. C4]MCD2172428.1 ribokinase [Rhizobium sp. C4]